MSAPLLEIPAGPAAAADHATGQAQRELAAVRALRLLFLVAGALYASWGVEIPAVKAHFALGEQALSWALLAAGLGTISAIACAAPALARWGERRVAQLTGVLMAAALAAVLLLTSYAALLVLMVLFGVVAGLFDVAINAQASELERRRGTPIMSGLHAWFSLGGLLGAGLGAGLLKLGLSPTRHLLLLGSLGVVAVLLGAWRMLAHRPAAPAPAEKARPHGALLLLGLLAASGLVAEGAMYDWSVLLMAQAHGATPVQAALAFASFSAAMAAGRFGGDALRARWPMVTLLRACGLIAALGMALTLSPVPLWAALAGCALVGLGLANVVPLLFSAAARVPGVTAAAGIASVSALGYAGLMAGPPLVGFMAERSSLALSLWLVVGFALLTAALAGRALRGVPASPGSAAAREGC